MEFLLLNLVIKSTNGLLMMFLLSIVLLVIVLLCISLLLHFPLNLLKIPLSILSPRTGKQMAAPAVFHREPFLRPNPDEEA